MTKDIQLAIADIDGTLTRDDGMLSEFTMDVLRRIHERGILLGLATGREYNQAMEERTARWGFADPGFDMVIGLNGGQIWDRKTQYLKSFNLLELIGSNCAEVREVETASLGVNVRTCLVNMVAENST